MKKPNVIFTVVSWACVAAMIVLIVVANSGKKNSSSDPQTVSSAVLACVDQQNVQPGDAQMIKRLYGLHPSDYESITLYYPVTNMGADEFLLVKLPDGADTAPVLAAIEKRLKTQKTTFEGYGAAQTALLNDHCVIEDRGNYVLFFVGAEDRAARSAFLSAL